MDSAKNFARDVEAAITRHRIDLWRYAVSLSRNRDLADDLTQATCLRALEKAGTLRHGTHLKAWLMTLCRSIWLNDLRAASLRKTEDLADVAAIIPDPQARGGETNIFVSEVLEHVMALPEAQREVVVLVYALGHKYREAAEILDVPIGTVMSRLAAARQTLAPLRKDIS